MLLTRQTNFFALILAAFGVWRLAVCDEPAKVTQAIVEHQMPLLKDGQLMRSLQNMKLCGKETASRILTTFNMTEIIQNAGNDTLDKESAAVLTFIDSICPQDQSASRILKANFILNQLSEGSSLMCESILHSAVQSPLNALLKTPIERAAFMNALSEEPEFVETAVEDLAQNPQYMMHMFGDLAALKNFNWVLAVGKIKMAELRSIDFLGLRRLLPIDGSAPETQESEIIVELLPKFYSALVDVAEIVEHKMGQDFGSLTPAKINEILKQFFEMCSVRHELGVHVVLGEVRDDWKVRLKTFIETLLRDGLTQEALYKTFYGFVFDRANLAALFEACWPHLVEHNSSTGEYVVKKSIDKQNADNARLMNAVSFPSMFRLLLLHEPFQVLFSNQQIKSYRKNTTYLHLLLDIDKYKMTDFANEAYDFDMDKITKLVLAVESLTGTDSIKVKTDVYNVRGIVDDAQKVDNPVEFSTKIWGGFMKASNWKEVSDLLNKPHEE